MDFLTLTICVVMFSAMTAAALLSLYITNRTDKPICDWAIAGALFFGCNLAVFVSSSYSLPWLLSPVLANAMYIAAHGFILSGITRQTRSESSHKTVALFTTAVFFIQFIPAVRENVNYRLVAIVPFMLTLNVLSLLHLWRFRRSAPGRGYWLAICVLAAFIAYTLLNISLVIIYPAPLIFLGDNIIQTTNLLATTLYIAGITLGVIFIHSWQREVTLRTISRTDALSGWYNRHALSEFANREFTRCQRHDTAFAFIIFDIDYFKKVNDTYGHIIGDRAIRHVANVAKEATREYDFHFRLGGEEFAMMLSGLDASDIKVIAERVRNAIHSTPFAASEYNIPLSVSLGIATMEDADLNWYVVLERADNALYKAKKGGRNKAELFNSQKHSLVRA